MEFRNLIDQNLNENFFAILAHYCPVKVDK